jgi:hypothetical protein
MSNDQVSEDNGDSDDMSEDDDKSKKYEIVHRKLFLRKAFGINLDGTAIPNIEEINGYPTPEYNCVKSVDQYNEIVTVLKHWGDDAFIKDHPDDPVAREYLRFRLRNKKVGYNYKRDWRLECVEDADGNAKTNLVKVSNNKIVLHSLDVFDAIREAHLQIGHLKTERTLQLMRPKYYSCTKDLCTIWISDCPGCHHKNDGMVKRKGASRPLISSEFRDRIQVDLIDMRTIRKRDVYGTMQRWIMTVKDHSTGLIYLVALPRKMANYVAAELEKYFGFIGYPHIFHTGMYSIVVVLVL